jgi:sugar phosphate isomerase/epimerase
MLQIREWCDEFGLLAKGVHATAGEHNSDLKHYVSADDYNRLAGVELVKNRVDLAHILDAEAIVLHLYLPWERFDADKDYRDLFYSYVLKSFDELEAYCKTRHIRICVENDNSTPEKHTYHMYDTLFGRYSADYMGLCFDTGHAAMICKENCLEYAEHYKDRLFMIHIHDNQGIHDEHLLPFEGCFNWEGFAPVLAHSSYNFPILMECSLRGESDESAWLEKAFAVGSRFSSMVQKYKE